MSAEERDHNKIKQHIMEIPNYDSGKSQNENFKQIYPYMPKNTFRMLVCGNSESTNIL